MLGVCDAGGGGGTPPAHLADAIIPEVEDLKAHVLGDTRRERGDARASNLVGP